MIGMEVRVTGAQELDRNRKRFKGSTIGTRICKNVADDITIAAKGLVPYWHGNLQKSIRVIPAENGYNIEMYFYGRFVEGGTRPHVVSINNYLFRAWAMSKNIPWGALRSSVRFRGTKAHPFIDRSVEYGLSRIHDTSISVLNKTAKESGFRNG